MQSDFHYGCVYLLARSAGFTVEPAQCLAYSCQQVDDCKLRGAEILLSDEQTYFPIPTAFPFPPPLDITVEDQIETTLPFHLIPGDLILNEGNLPLTERCVVQSVAPLANKALENVLHHIQTPYGLHLAGIALHAYADTWAHEGFNCFASRVNEVRDCVPAPALVGDEPPVGHAQALSIPDLPWAHWRYINHRGETIARNNPERFLRAAERIFGFLVSLLPSCESHRDTTRKMIHWTRIKPMIQTLLMTGNTTQEYDESLRLNSWIAAASDGSFGFKDSLPAYQKDEWFCEAVMKKGPFYYAKPGFMESDWKMFQDAARVHQAFVLSHFDGGLFHPQEQDGAQAGLPLPKAS